MILELIRTSASDEREESYAYQATKRPYKSHIDGDDFACIHFTFSDRPGKNLPFVRVALDFEDAMRIIDVLAEKGDSKAALAKNACQFAFSTADFAKNSS